MAIITNAQTGMEQLGSLYEQGCWIFRGHASFKYRLEPYAFRAAAITKMRRDFDVKSTSQWFKSKDIIEFIDLYAPGARSHHNSLMVIQKLLNYCLYIMQYNYSLSLYVRDKPHMVSSKDCESILLRDCAYWKQEKTFIYLVMSYFPTILQRSDLKGKLIQGANPFEDLASVDETLPQHYGIPTAALDWSFNPNIALFFALNNADILPGFLSLYALKIEDDAINSPIKIINKSDQIENKRAESQEGCFTYFKRPCSFFLEHGMLPSINYYDARYKNGLDKPTFELLEFRIERNKENILYLSDLLANNGINRSYLFPN